MLRLSGTRLPAFRSDEEERAFWEAPNPGDYMEKGLVFGDLRRIESPRNSSRIPTLFRKTI
ncbi:MAG: hypothetical protein A2Z31_06830 [candidate division NC10 bacterium RBG_16_65_8]|nr:MAG: hypothetical protein A2Z31_06830 [candidate division NC10 bacterium RBG_16_65_8]